MNRPNLSVPDLSVSDVAMPDVGGIAGSLLDLAATAADAVSSAAGHVPGLDDYRASNRRRNALMTIGALAAAIALVLYLKRRSSAEDTPSSGAR